ncbi:hypothetical protein F4818DRAFT_431852 [Hypoxylon cercidicola]|nr:hypothetical protein F4818DRAFT_431852 [Hypoxylon cercidicola]
MELQRGADGDQSAIDHAKQNQIATILRSIDELVAATLESNNAAIEQHTANSDDSALRSYQSKLLQDFKDMMVTVHSKVSKATHEVGLQLGPSTYADCSPVATDSQLEDLIGVETESHLNRFLGRINVNGKQSYKLRDYGTGVENFQLTIDDSPVAASPQGPQDPLVVLDTTLRNVWIVQYAYAQISKHKEDLIKEYLTTVGPNAGVSRKISREYYEDMSLTNVPSKEKLGNLLDVKRSSQNHETHDLMVVLVAMKPDGSLQYKEAVTGDEISIDQTHGINSYLILPMAEASMKKLYDIYRILRKETLEQRRAAKNKEFAAQLQVDVMDGLREHFSSIGGMEFGGTNDDVGSGGGGSKKRRRMLDDDEGRD